MPKSLVLGNGNVLICLDEQARLRDFYFHHIGLENHVGGGCMHKLGIQVDGVFSWLEGEDWELKIDYQKDALVSKIRARNEKLGVELLFNDAVYNEENIFLRKVTVKNEWKEKRIVKLFFHQQFRIYDTERRDTGYYDPDRNVIVHYEGRRVFVIGGSCDKKGMDDYSIGNYGIEGKEGTWKDAEDGVLGKNGIEHGPVDSVMGFYFELEPEKKKVVDYWISAAMTLREARKIHEYVLDKKPKYLIKTTQDFWRAWLAKDEIDFGGLSKETAELYKKSLLIVRTHVDNAGGIIASGDSDMLQYGRDTYAYVWPRDGAFVALALIKAKNHSLTKNFFGFCNDVISDEGYFLHKYRPDRSIGSSWHPWVKNGKKQLAIQEDETALIIYALWEYYKESRDLEFIEKVYNSLIKKAAEFMYHYRNQHTGLPRSSYDLWEQKYGTSTFTTCTVYGGLLAASRFADILGKKDDAEKYREEAEEMKRLVVKYLHNNKNGYFYNRLVHKEGAFEFDETVDMSSFFGVFYFGILEVGEEMLERAYDVVREKLFCETEVGGVMRYVDDEYHRVSDTAPGNPWFITTLWDAQYKIAKAKTKKELEQVKEVFGWVEKFATSAGLLSEQLSVNKGEQLSASPLTWSHAEFVATVLQYLEKEKAFGKNK